jgi:putative endopeptidase
MTHGYDSIGHRFDADGKWMNWWTNKTKKAFEGKFECLINQYNNFTDPLSGVQLNGTKTLNENVADNGEKMK